MRLVKCSICGKKLKPDEAYKISSKTGESFYCNSKEYFTWFKNDTWRKKAVKLADSILDIPNYWASINKAIKELGNKYEFEKIHDCIEENEEYLDWLFQHKDFAHKYGKMRYFFTVIENKLEEYEWEPVEEREAVEVESDFEMNYKHTSSTSRKALIDIELDFDDDDEEY